jgi:hypothetical protein
VLRLIFKKITIVGTKQLRGWKFHAALDVRQKNKSRHYLMENELNFIKLEIPLLELKKFVYFNPRLYKKLHLK